MLGIINGNRKVIVIGVASRLDSRMTPILAIVPRTVATSVAPPATMKLFAAAFCHWRLVKNSSYQRVEKPTGGKEMKSAALKEMGMTMIVGRSMKQHTA